MALKNLTANLKKDPHSITAKPEETAAPAAVQTEEPKAKKKSGRPKDEIIMQVETFCRVSDNLSEALDKFFKWL